MAGELPHQVFLPIAMGAPENIGAGAHTTYLPLVMTGGSTHFQIDHTRLWSAVENGAPSGAPCGTARRVHVHVFDVHGDSAGATRLDNVVIAITHFKDGQTTLETQATGVPGLQEGTVEFELHEYALVGVVSDANGAPVVSAAALVTAVAASIDPQLLISAGYCRDLDSCRRFVQENTCQGQFSWDVAFRRSY